MFSLFTCQKVILAVLTGKQHFIAVHTPYGSALTHSAFRSPVSVLVGYLIQDPSYLMATHWWIFYFYLCLVL